ncbi:sensor histidine kinase [Salinithrix halophila]|uniref:Oxygen sensor histidine kinase NreB n=1 Tax=Salinithrix halophila TaxID=1485204 RepID=A0ABV8JE61_9BACL
MKEDVQDRQWRTLRTIAETLNRSTDVRPMLQSVLEELLQVTGLTTGWIFLVEKEPNFTPVALYNLPPALSWGEGKPMCRGRCWCLDRVWDGRLKKAVNIIECKRLEDAVKQQWGDTRGITHHATVPLSVGSELIGLLNVASPGKERFSDEELALLQSVAYQIGTAVKKTWLYEAQQKRAEQYARLDEASRLIWGSRDQDDLPEKAVCHLARIFDWPLIACWIRRGHKLTLRSLSLKGECIAPAVSFPLETLGAVGKAFSLQKAVRSEEGLEEIRSLWSDCTVIAAAPISIRGEKTGVISVGSHHRRDLEEIDLEVLKALGEHISLAMESARLEEERQRLLISEERNRLARDLHDSVSQKLFSLSLNARASQDVLTEPNALLLESLRDIQTLSGEALKEMRSLIWQLRPAGLEEGVISALKKYGERLGLTVRERIEGVIRLSRRREETLWRIGQEALNNVSKHAGTDRVSLTFSSGKEEVTLSVQDDGKGFVYDPEKDQESCLGLTGMEERVRLLGGTLEIESAPGAGTTLTVVLPVRGQKGGDGNDPVAIGG